MRNTPYIILVVLLIGIGAIWLMGQRHQSAKSVELSKTTTASPAPGASATPTTPAPATKFDKADLAALKVKLPVGADIHRWERKLRKAVKKVEIATGRNWWGESTWKAPNYDDKTDRKNYYSSTELSKAQAVHHVILVGVLQQIASMKNPQLQAHAYKLLVDCDERCYRVGDAWDWRLFRDETSGDDQLKGILAFDGRTALSTKADTSKTPAPKPTPTPAPISTPNPAGTGKGITHPKPEREARKESLGGKKVTPTPAPSATPTSAPDSKPVPDPTTKPTGMPLPSDTPSTQPDGSQKPEATTTPEVAPTTQPTTVPSGSPSP